MEGPDEHRGKAQPGAAAAARVAPLSLAPLNATSLRDQAYALLKAAIADTDIYNPQQELRLDERQLITALGVSRTPIREALSLLEQEGFIRTIPRRGIYIVRKSKREIIEMIQMWAALESMAARLATLHAPDAEIAKLRHLFDEFLQLAARPSTWTSIPTPTSRFTPRSSASVVRRRSSTRRAICCCTCARSVARRSRKATAPRARSSIT